MEQVHDVSPRRTFDLDQRLKAELFEVTTNKGDSYIGIRFEQHLPNGTVREFHTDLAKLSFIEKLAGEYARSSSGAEHFERAANIELRLKSGTFEARGEAIRVHVYQEERFNPDAWQSCDFFTDNLKAVVEEGKKLATEIGIKEWFVLADAKSLTQDESGRINAQAVVSFDSEEKARDHLGRSGGSLALYLEPQRRELSKGDTIELWPNAKMLTKGEHEPKSVEHQLGQAEWDKGRDGERYAVARWDDKYNPPEMNARTKLDGTGYEASNLKPEDYRAGYNPGRERGDLKEPMWVLIEKDRDKPGLGNIRGISGDRDDMVAELKKREGASHEVTKDLKRREETQQAVTKDWDRQAFQMDRNRFT